MRYFSRVERGTKLTSELIAVGFFLTIGYAVVETMFSVYLKNYYNLPKSQIGLISLILNVCAIFTAFGANYFLEKYHEKRVFVCSLSLLVLIYFCVFFANSIMFFMSFMILANILNVLRSYSFNILYRDSSSDEDVVKDEGFIYSVENLSWFLAPVLTGFFLIRFSVENMFLLADLFILIGLVLYFFANVREVEHRTNSKPLIFENIKKFFSNDVYRVAYFASSGSAVINSFAYTFMTLILMERGVSDHVLGLFLGFITVPMVLFEFENGRIVKKLGFRNTFSLGYLIIMFFVVCVFLVDDVFLKMVFFVLAFLGTALIEPTRDSYFFTNTPKDDEEKFYSIFKTNSYLGLIVTKVVFSLFFLYSFDSNFAFLLLVSLICVNFIFSRFISK